MKSTIKIEDLKDVFNSLINSWGGDTPPEAVWTANKLMKLAGGVIDLDESCDNYEEFLNQII